MTKRNIRPLKEAPTPQEILREPYARILVPEDDGTYSAEILEFHGCFGEGDTAAEAIKDLEDAAVCWIEATIEQGQEIPPPTAVHEFSGRVNLRLPRSIHKQAAKYAEKENVSLNQFFSSAIAASVGAEVFCERLVQRLQCNMPSISLTVVNAEFNYDFLLPAEQAGGSIQYKTLESSDWEVRTPDEWKIPLLTDQSTGASTND